MDYVQHLNDKEKFVQEVKNRIASKAFDAIDDIKREVAADFLKAEEETEDES